MHYPKIDDPPKSHISPRVLRLIRHSLLKLRPYFQVLFCNKQENYSVSLWLRVRFWLRLCLPCETFVALVSLGARPKPLNHALFILLFLSFLLTPLHSCNAKDEASSDFADNVILYEDWEKKNFKNWDDDFRQGDTTIESDPVFAGAYAVKQRASNPGSLVHFFGDHPGLDGKTIDDVTLESYLYFPPGFQWPSGGITLWTLACFEGWSAGYNKAEGAGKPLAWAPFFVMIALKESGAPLMFLTLADDFGGPGDLYRTFGQNIGETKPIELGAWTKLKFRLRLNTPGNHHGIFQLRINDDLKCNYSNINFRGTYEKYGWNHLMMSFMGSPSKADTQWISRDNILLTAGDHSTAIPIVRKKILRKSPSSPLPPQVAAKPDAPLTAESTEKRPIPKSPTGLSIVSPTEETRHGAIPTLPEGNSGLAGRYPGDKGIEKDPNVIFVEKFDDGPGYEISDPVALQLVFSRWDTVKGKEIMSLSNDVPEGSADDRSLVMTHEHGQEGGELYRRLLPGHDKIFVRYYVKFHSQCAPMTHFGAWMGGYNPPTTWPQGGAGSKPSGKKRFTTSIEPYGDKWAWDFYTYWQGMHAHGDGKYWGTTFLVYGPKPVVDKGKWVCVETMVQMNDPVTSSNGSQAFWIDGKLFRRDGQIVSYFGPGFPKGEWAGGWWRPDPESNSMFEGFQWRTVEDLSVNFIWLQAYRPHTAKGQLSKVWFDNIIVAKEYIGPISPAN